MNFTRRTVTAALVLVLSLGCLILPASAAENTMYGIGFVNTDSLRLRTDASTSSSILATAPKNDCVIVVSKEGNWYKVIYNLIEGYMHESYLDVSTKENAELGYGTVTGRGVNLRSGPDTSCSVTAVASQGEKCYIIGLNEGWYKVIHNDTTCYIRSDYLELTEYPYENQKSSNSPKYFRRGKSIGTVSSGTTDPSSASPVNISGSQILAEAKRYLGCPYVAGGSSPSGFDCSGFVYYVLKQLGYSPYRTPAEQFNMGTAISKGNLCAGDIVFFAGTGSGNGISHVGIYAGNGQFIHAPNSRSTVSYSNLNSGYWAEHYYGACRILA